MMVMVKLTKMMNMMKMSNEGSHASESALFCFVYTIALSSAEKENFLFVSKYVII